MPPNNAGTLTVDNSTVSESGAFNGGAIYNRSGTLANSNGTLSGNVAFRLVGYGISGGGIYNDATGTVTVKNASDVTGNTADVLGGDVYNPGVLYLDSTSTIGLLDGNPPIPI